MSNFDKFGLVSGIIGLIADILALAAVFHFQPSGQSVSLNSWLVLPITGIYGTRGPRWFSRYYETLTLKSAGGKMLVMSQVDFMLGILTSLIATILFELRFVLMKSAKYFVRTIGRAWAITPSLKLNLITIILIPFCLVGVIRLSTQTVLAPSNHLEITELAANKEELRRIREELIKLNQELKENRGIGPEYHRKSKNIYALILNGSAR
jgi:hypothetical protein